MQHARRGFNGSSRSSSAAIHIMNIRLERCQTLSKHALHARSSMYSSSSAASHSARMSLTNTMHVCCSAAAAAAAAAMVLALTKDGAGQQCCQQLSQDVDVGQLLATAKNSQGACGSSSSVSH
jgi:hypothetical protein